MHDLKLVKITVDKLSSSGDYLLAELRLVAYLHGIETTYPDFAAAQRSSARTKIPELLTVMAELEDEGKQARADETTTLPLQSKIKRRLNQWPFRGGHAMGRNLTLRSKRSKYSCAYCDFTSHSEDSCWKKYPERIPLWWKSEDSNDPKPGSKNRGKNKRVIFNFAAIARSYDHVTAYYAFPSRVNEMEPRWHVDIGCFDHMCNKRLHFINYRAVYQPPQYKLPCRKGIISCWDRQCPIYS